MIMFLFEDIFTFGANQGYRLNWGQEDASHSLHFTIFVFCTFKLLIKKKSSSKNVFFFYFCALGFDSQAKYVMHYFVGGGCLDFFAASELKKALRVFQIKMTLSNLYCNSQLIYT